MNIYEFQTSGEKEWVCANTLIEAIQFYLNLTSQNIQDFSDTDDIVIVPESKWAEMNILDIERTDNDGNHPVEMTFEQYMKRASNPDIIATTCY